MTFSINHGDSGHALVWAQVNPYSSRNALSLPAPFNREFLLLCFLHQCQLLGIAAAYGDLQAVRYLLKEALVVLPTEPNDDNAAVVAAYFGHKDVVKELLDSLRGKPLLGPASPQAFQELCATASSRHLGFFTFLGRGGI